MRRWKKIVFEDLWDMLLEIYKEEEVELDPIMDCILKCKNCGYVGTVREFLRITPPRYWRSSICTAKYRGEEVDVQPYFVCPRCFYHIAYIREEDLARIGLLAL